MTYSTAVFTMDPDDKLDFQVDWSTWLTTLDTLSTATWSLNSTTITASTALMSYSTSAGTHTLWLQAPVAGTTYEITSRITTASTRIKDQTFKVVGREQ
jgi:hypothetical protein